ncbi:MAG: hypothetical protein CM1200mP39_07790 [Dehalococcoidia bacterium]|nr:MAG: hypothetical protein CM1200mP39_07790 [Dehalococcoidia bacterium]
MPDKKISPYGSWVSPITAELITQGGLRLGEVRVDGRISTGLRAARRNRVAMS